MEHVRDRMVRAAARLLSRDGLEGTSFSTVLAASGAPRGSVYHHFPGGKDQLVEQAVRAVGAGLVARAAQLRPAGPGAAVREVAGLWRDALVTADRVDGCAVAAVGVAGGPAQREVVGEVFADWERAVAAVLARSGLPDERAERFAGTVIAGVEGAVVLARAAGGPAPFDRVVDDLAELAETLPRR